MESKARKPRGRGTANENTARYLELSRERTVDEDALFEDRALKTEVFEEQAKSVISRNSSPDVPFELSINPYRGCEHGCSYCYARPTHAYLDLSPGLDFETKIIARTNAAQKLREELAAPGYVCKAIALGSNTDPYQPVERNYRITRQIIEVLADCRHPLTIVTKSHLVVRDIDLLAGLAEQSLVQVFMSVTTLDAGLANSLEPRASTPFRRVEALASLARAGVPTGLLFAPVIPFVNDAEMEDILARCVESGIETAGYVLLRLPLEVRDIFIEWLEHNLPLRKDHVMNVLRDLRGGKDYDSTFHSRMRGEGAYADLIEGRFNAACRKLALNTKKRQLDCTRFQPPELPGTQYNLF